jgi:WXG100 family type VII secretion target
MDTGPVFAIIRAGFALLDKTIEDVTGDPNELRAKARECSRCATEINSAADATHRVVNQLGQTWNGQAYDSCNDVSTQLVRLLQEVLRRDLEQESQRLSGAAEALDQARNAAQQQKQDFAQQAMQIVQQMMQAIQAAQAAPPWMRAILIALAIMQAIMQAMQAKNKAQQAAQQTRDQLSSRLSGLFSQQSSVPQLAAV